MRYLLNKKIEGRVFVFLVVIGFAAGCAINHKEKAQQHLLKALEEYEKTVLENPQDNTLREKYYELARMCLGEAQAKVELMLLYQKIGRQKQAEEILKSIAPADSQQVAQYLKKKLESAYDINQRIAIYQTLTLLTPEDPELFEQLGRLYLGTNQTENGINALRTSIELGNRNNEAIKYFVSSCIKQKQYEQATDVLKKLIEEKDEIQLRQQLADIYKKQGKKELYLAEIETIATKTGKKPPLLAFKKSEIQKPSAQVQKKSELPVLSEKIDIEPYKFLLVDKSQQKLFVYEFDGRSLRELISVNCTTGKNMDDKKKPGDLATPEGSFLIKSFIPGTKLEPKYGAGAYVLDFPDYLSRRLDKDGSGIWLHGTPIERPPYNSEGCVVVNDNDFLALQPYIEVGKTYIHIVKNQNDLNLTDILYVWNTIQSWKQSWENLNTEKYLSYYDDNFRSDGKDKQSWAQYKRKVNKNKKYVKVELQDTKIIPYGNTSFGYVFLVDTIQHYDSSDLKSTTRKNLYLAKTNGSYKIIGELVK